MMMIRLTTIARTGRRMNRSVNRMSVVFRLRVQLRVGADGVVDHDRGVVAQLEGARGHQLLPILHAVEHGDEVAACLTETPTTTVSSCCWGIEKSTYTAPTACSTVSVVPGFRYWPTLTARMPSRPENGARTILRAI